MSLLILKPGLLDTIQDNGRYGFTGWGINASGTMDRYAAQVANALVGNALHEGVVEMHFPASAILFQMDALISVTGADYNPYIKETHVPLWRPVLVKKGSVLSFRKKNKGNRCYLAVHGGFDLSPWLGSVSTNLKIAAGGLHGSALQKDDVIPLCEKASDFSGIFEMYHKRNGLNTHKDLTIVPWSVNYHAVYENQYEIFFIEGNEWNTLTDEAQAWMTSLPFVIDSSADRMGYRLKQKPLSYRDRARLISSGVSFGTIQGLPDGQLVILMADHQTTGGYPRIGHVITAHLPKLAQLGAGDHVHFKKISVEAAEKILFSLQEDLATLQQACLSKLNDSTV